MWQRGRRVYQRALAFGSRGSQVAHQLCRGPSARYWAVWYRPPMAFRFGWMRILASAISLLLFAAMAAAQGQAGRRAHPAPRWPDGTINLGAPLGETGK